MSTRTIILSATFAAASAVAATGCDQRCGEGTIDRDGVCVPADVNPDEANCGLNTKIGDDGKCVPVYDPTICDDPTTDPDTTTIPGVTICVGTGVAGCDSALACPPADAGKISVCGRLYDTQTSEQIRALTPTFAECGNGGAEDGPCSLGIAFFDAVAFAQNPTGTAPLPPQNFYMDDCGRFTAQNIMSPQFGFVGVAVDDNPLVSDGVDYELTGVAEESGSGLVIPGVRAYATRQSTTDDWSADVGIDLVTEGVFMAIHTWAGAPVEGVRIIDTNRPGTTANYDYYFNDVDPSLRAEADPDGPNNDNRTGPNGVSLLLYSALSVHTSEGGLPATCEWPEAQAVSIENAVFVSERVAQVLGGDETTPCPAP